jgi:MFS family permease
MGHDAGWTSPPVVALTLVAALGLTGFLWHEHRTANPLLPLGLLRQRPVAAAGIAALAQFAALNGLLFLAPLYFHEFGGYSPLQSGLAVVPLGLTVIVASNVAGRLLQRSGLRQILALGQGLLAVGGAAWALATTAEVAYWARLLPALVTFAAGSGIAFTAMTAASLTDVPDEERGVAGGLNLTAQQMGAALGVAAMVALAASRADALDGTPEAVLAGYRTALFAAAATCGVAAVITAVVLPTGRRAAEPAPTEPAPAKPSAQPAVPGTAHR